MESKELKLLLSKLSKEELQESLNEFSIIIIEIGKELKKRK